MSISKQIRAFLDVSEKFFYQAGCQPLMQGWSAVELASVPHGPQISGQEAFPTLRAAADSASGGNGG